METTLTVKIDNMIRGKNFLSYLYGWEKTILGTSKEKFYKRNRILITNNGKIIINTFDVLNFLDCMEFITSEFGKGRMGYYLVWDEKVVMKTEFVTKIKLDEFYYSEKGFLEYDYGTIEIDKGTAILKHSNYEDGMKLMETFQDIYVRPQKEKLCKVVIVEKENMSETSYFSESLIVSSLVLFTGLKLIEYLS